MSILTAITFLYLAIKWSKKNWLNFLVKVYFIGLTVFWIVYSLQSLGYVLKK